jgi:hypothetical protein
MLSTCTSSRQGPKNRFRDHNLFTLHGFHYRDLLFHDFASQGWEGKIREKLSLIVIVRDLIDVHNQVDTDMECMSYCIGTDDPPYR